MTISVDSVWVLFGIAVILGAGAYLGVLYMVIFIRAGKKLGIMIADYIVIPVVQWAANWRRKWKS